MVPPVGIEPTSLRFQRSALTTSATAACFVKARPISVVGTLPGARSTPRGLHHPGRRSRRSYRDPAPSREHCSKRGSYMVPQVRIERTSPRLQLGAKTTSATAACDPGRTARRRGIELVPPQGVEPSTSGISRQDAHRYTRAAVPRTEGLSNMADWTGFEPAHTELTTRRVNHFTTSP